MNQRVRLFASFRQAAGVGEVEVEVGPEPRVRDVLDALRDAYPGLDPALAAAMVAVNLEYVGPDFRLNPGDEVAIIPPVSGGRA